MPKPREFEEEFASSSAAPVRQGKDTGHGVDDARKKGRAAAVPQT